MSILFQFTFEITKRCRRWRRRHTVGVHPFGIGIWIIGVGLGRTGTHHDGTTSSHIHASSSSHGRRLLCDTLASWVDR
ncbi:hypothetical protein BCR44DRAFT_1434964 [Catenaria anguillulae PL171]|uniref:Uncharacterized protein n=1 Tax=Catenaria anguillulae PL171 TaxID=765915 RepID=A0A1Y2HKD5_9FUNG|nr:hypothetical protein BCR44DRAFT_1434964 [Catenaria anguillulae PL171]